MATIQPEITLQILLPLTFGHRTELILALSHSPALIGIAALVVLYYGYREWKKEKDVVVESAPESSKPYSNFEDEWNKLMKN